MARVQWIMRHKYIQAISFISRVRRATAQPNCHNEQLVGTTRHKAGSRRHETFMRVATKYLDKPAFSSLESLHCACLWDYTGRAVNESLITIALLGNREESLIDGEPRNRNNFCKHKCSVRARSSAGAQCPMPGGRTLYPDAYVGARIRFCTQCRSDSRPPPWSNLSRSHPYVVRREQHTQELNTAKFSLSQNNVNSNRILLRSDRKKF